MWLMQNGMAKPDNAGAASTDYLHLFGLVALGYMWARMAKVRRKLAAGDDGAASFYDDKLVTGRFFMERVMPETAGASRPHLERRRHADGAAGGSVLRRLREARRSDGGTHAAAPGAARFRWGPRPAESQPGPARMSACSTTWRRASSPRRSRRATTNSRRTRYSTAKAGQGRAGRACSAPRCPRNIGGSGGTFAP